MVYVGAVAVLFLFVVMMLDVDFAELRQGALRISADRRAGRHRVPGGAAAGRWGLDPICAGIAEGIASPIPPPFYSVTNTEALGQVLYTRYVFFFQAAGLILLVAMIGAIVLTLRHKPNVKRQDISQQVARTREDAIEVVKVKSGQGLS